MDDEGITRRFREGLEATGDIREAVRAGEYMWEDESKISKVGDGESVGVIIVRLVLICVVVVG